MSEIEIGKIIHTFPKIAVAIIELREALHVGDTIHIKGAHDDFTQTVESIQVDHNAVDHAEAGMQAGIKVISKVHVNDRVFK